jgi:hypothetical protein
VQVPMQARMHECHCARTAGGIEGRLAWRLPEESIKPANGQRYQARGGPGAAFIHRYAAFASDLSTAAAISRHVRCGRATLCVAALRRSMLPVCDAFVQTHSSEKCIAKAATVSAAPRRAPAVPTHSASKTGGQVISKNEKITLKNEISIPGINDFFIFTRLL